MVLNAIALETVILKQNEEGRLIVEERIKDKDCECGYEYQEKFNFDY